MKRATYDLLTNELDKLVYLKDIVEQQGVKEKLEGHINTLRSLINEEYSIGGTNKRGCKAARADFVKNNPALLRGAQKIIDSASGETINVSDLFEDKYFRVVITYVKTKLKDFRYFTYDVNESKMLVKTSGTLIDEGETFESSF